MTEKINKLGNVNQDQIRGDQVVIDQITGAVVSEYLTKAKHVLGELNKVSKTMCLAKWYYSTINLTTAQTQSCYHPTPTPIPEDELLQNSSALHNTRFKKNQRNPACCFFTFSNCI